jgi:integrase/recombinase XerD
MKRRASMLTQVQEYLVVRRALGVQLRIEGAQLLDFARYADSIGHRGPITIALAVRWARSSVRCSQLGWARRLEVIRPFARYRLAFDHRTQLIPSKLFGPAHPRKQPHVYTETEIRALLAAASRLSPLDGLRPLTIRTVLGLLACTGLRPAEAVKLTRFDVDLETGVLTIRETKFAKSRLVPLHWSATRALRRYVRIRDRKLRVPIAPSFFVIDGGVPFTKSKLRTAFIRIRRGLGWATTPPQRRPRLYDLRHAFACRRLLRWCAAGVDVHRALPALSTYLGHVKVSDTYWYLTGIPELMAITAERFERFARHEGGDQ